MSVEAVLVLLLAIAIGCVLTYVASQRALVRRFTDLQDTTRRELSSMAAGLKGLETQLAAMRSVVAAAAAPPAPAKVETTPPPPRQPKEEREITPDLLVMLAAAVTTFLGKKVRIHSAKVLHSPYDAASAWSQQGRVLVQTSHNLRVRN